MDELNDEVIIKSFKSFIKKIAMNAAIDYARKVKRSKIVEVSLNELVERKVSMSLCDNDAFFCIEEKSSNINLLQEILKLPQKDQEIIKLLRKGYSNQKISTLLNISEKTVRNRKSIIKRKLEERIKKSYENNNIK